MRRGFSEKFYILKKHRRHVLLPVNLRVPQRDSSPRGPVRAPCAASPLPCPCWAALRPLSDAPTSALALPPHLCALAFFLQPHLTFLRRSVDTVIEGGHTAEVTLTSSPGH